MVHKTPIPRRSFLGLGLVSVWLSLLSRSVQAKLMNLNGWLRIEKLQGRAISRHRNDSFPLQAWVGQKLDRVGERLETGEAAQVSLVLDSGLGTVIVAENTILEIKALHANASGGRVTQLSILQGQIRLKLRKMENPESRFEVQTPAGITGVRGTEFGVAVQPSGQTGVATLSGQVDASALNQTVAVGQALQTLLIPSQPPQEPEPLRDDPDLRMTEAKQAEHQLLLSGVMDPVNVLLVDGIPQKTSPTGEFRIVVPLVGQQRVTLQAITPLGTQRKYEIPLA